MGRPCAGGLSLEDVRRARARLGGVIGETPLANSAELSRLARAPVHLKLENRQLTGSFKLRGALNAVLTLTDTERERGVVTVSTGNHGRAVAFACKRAGVRAVVCMSRLVPVNKVAAIRELGAEVRVSGQSQDEAQLEADRLVAEEGLTLVPPFDHAEVIAGQGTIGLEIVEQLEKLPTVAGGSDDPPTRMAGRTARSGPPPDEDRVLMGERASPRRRPTGRSPADAGPKPTVIVPLSGGGLISGVALAVKACKPEAQVVGVSMERGCAMYQSQRAGRPLAVLEEATLADSLGGGVGLDNRYTFQMVRDLVDELVLVSEESIAAAIAHAYRFDGQVLEGAGAAGIAALLANSEAGLPAAARGPIVVVVSGGNIDPKLHSRLVSQAGTSGGRREE